jgi:hypothetical protein
MRRPKLKRPAPGTALGFLALLVALAGNANAFTSTHVIVRRGDIAKGAVTANALAKGAVRPRALAKGAVTTRAIRPGAVTAAALDPDAVGPTAIKSGAVGAQALAPNAVTSSALAPGSVYGGALGPVSIHTTPIADLDETADLSTWTTSNTETASCAPGERLLSGGVIFTNPGNRRVGIVRSLPFSIAGQDGVSGQITSDSGGSSTAEVQAICLK